MAAIPTPFFDRQLDVTPKISFSTMQFDSEAVNTVINAILAALIVANLGSIVHKLINVTERDHFCYRDYLRAMLFNSSDDVTRLLAWLNGSDSYMSKLWKKHDARVRWQRLLIPGCARIFVLLVTFASIALTIPSERRFELCTRDFTPNLVDREVPDPVRELPSVCADIALKTQRGTVNSRLAYCSFQPATVPSRPALSAEETAAPGLIETSYDPTTATLTVIFQSGGNVTSRQFYTEWSLSEGSGIKRRKKFRSMFNELDNRVPPNLALRAIRDDERDCVALGTSRLTDQGVRQPVSCVFDVDRAQIAVDAYLRAALDWSLKTSTQLRVVLQPDGQLSVQSDCPIVISVNRPYMNMLPMALMLLLVFQLNLAVSLTVSQHGNIDDAAFHLMKEAVSVDVTSNPLQLTDGDKDVDFKLPFRWMHCSNGTNAHAGFLNTSDCTEANLEAEPRRYVSRCMHSENRLVVAKFASPSSGDGSSMNMDPGSSRQARAPRY